MLKRNLKYPLSAVSKRLKDFGLALEASPLLSRADQLIFLCGANQSPNVPSARRQALKRFIESTSDSCRVVYAEGVFNELAKIGNRGNVLDLEHEISEIADKIVIVLESPSSFCELGAFAHKKLRDKLVVINDTAFKESASFINTGPLAAMIEKKAPVLWYPMQSNGLQVLDSIGSVFGAVADAVYEHPFKGSEEVKVSLASLGADKPSLYLAHDLVLFAGPATYDELTTILISMYGKRPYDQLKKLLGILKSADLIRSNLVDGAWVYSTDSPRPYLDYHFDASAMTAAFRSFHLEHNPTRFTYA